MTTPAGTTSYEYNNVGQLESVSTGSQSTTFVYDPVGFLTEKHLPNGVTTYYTPNERNQLESVVSKNSSNAVLQSFVYNLDDAGNRLSVSEVGSGSIVWDYDNLYRLTSETRYNNGNTIVAQASFVYDAVGNRDSMTIDGVVTDYEYNELDQLISAGSITYDYDERGNLIEEQNGSQTTTYIYDAADRLASVTLPDTTAISYNYDADGRRTKQTVGSDVTNYLWDELSPYGDVILETSASGNILASYTLADSELISQTRNSVDIFYLQDGLGSVRSLADENGNITNTYAYTAFGEIYSQTGSVNNNYLYTGQQFDEQTGLYNLRARYYDPSNGRFLTRDTIGYDIANPVELNRYGYTANNPVNAIDPTGHQAFSEYVTNSLKGAGLGAVTNFGFDVTYQAIFLERGLNEIDWTQALRSAIAGAAAGFVGGIIGTRALTFFGKGFTGVVFTGMFSGWIEGMIARGVFNLQNNQAFFSNYTFQSAITDAIVGGLTAGFFYTTINIFTKRGLSPNKFFTPEELAKYNDLKSKYPDWMPPDDVKLRIRSKAETAEIRSQVKGSGHHKQPLKFGGDPNPSNGLQYTGDTRGYKNPIHTIITNFWNAIMRRRK